MCQEIKSIQIARSKKWSNGAKKRRTYRVYVNCPHGIQSVFQCGKNLGGGWRTNGQVSAKYLAFEAWPAQVQAFVREQLMPQLKPKKSTDPMAKVLQAKSDAEKKLAEWTKRANMAATKVRQYAGKLWRATRAVEQLQQTPIASSAAGRSFAKLGDDA
jgi:hypothetical protein